MESRLTELEAKLSFAEDQIETLNRSVWRLQEQIDGLQGQLRLLYRQMQAGSRSDDEGGGPEDGADRLREEIPPHY